VRQHSRGRRSPRHPRQPIKSTSSSRCSTSSTRSSSTGSGRGLRTTRTARRTRTLIEFMQTETSGTSAGNKTEESPLARRAAARQVAATAPARQAAVTWPPTRGQKAPLASPPWSGTEPAWPGKSDCASHARPGAKARARRHAHAADRPDGGQHLQLPDLAPGRRCARVARRSRPEGDRRREATAEPRMRKPRDGLAWASRSPSLPCGEIEGGHRREAAGLPKWGLLLAHLQPPAMRVCAQKADQRSGQRNPRRPAC